MSLTTATNRYGTWDAGNSPYAGGGGSLHLTGYAYVEVANGGVFAIGQNDFVLEWWQYQTSASDGAGSFHPRVFSLGSYPFETIGVSIEGGSFIYWSGNQVAASFDVSSGLINQWNFFRIVRSSGQTTIYRNGQVAAGPFQDTVDYQNTADALAIGAESNGSSTFLGYLTGFSWATGVTGDVTTIPTTPPADGESTIYTFSSNDFAASFGPLYFNAAVDKDLNNVANWWRDSACTIPALAVPAAGDIAEILVSYDAGYGQIIGSLTAAKMNVRGSSFAPMNFADWGGTLAVQEFHFYDTSTTGFLFTDKNIYFHDQSSFFEICATTGNGYYWWCVDGAYAGGFIDGKWLGLCSLPDNTYGIDGTKATSFSFDTFGLYVVFSLEFYVPCAFINGARASVDSSYLSCNFYSPVTMDAPSAVVYILYSNPDNNYRAWFYGDLTIASSGGTSRSRLLLNQLLQLPFPITV